VNRCRFAVRRSWLRELQPPEVGSWRKELNSHPLAPFAKIAQKNNPALDLFLGLRIRDRQQLAIVHFVFQGQESAVRADHKCLARFTEFFAIVSASLRLHLHLAEDTSAAPGSGKLDGGHHAFIIEKPGLRVNWATGQVYRIEKWYALRLFLGVGGLTIENWHKLAGIWVRSFILLRNIFTPKSVSYSGKD